MPPRRSDAADRILREAMRLFSERGYERTSIADIQAAAGLAPGSGAMYKHFPSKETVLRAGIEAFARDASRAHDVIAQLPEDNATAFATMARAALAMLSADRDSLRIVWRDLESFPELQQMVKEHRMRPTFTLLSEMLGERVASGQLRPHDTEAMAAVIVSSLVMYGLMDALLGEPPGRVDPERYVQAWTDLVAHGLSARPEDEWAGPAG